MEVLKQTLRELIEQAEGNIESIEIDMADLPPGHQEWVSLSTLQIVLRTDIETYKRMLAQHEA